MDTKVLENKGAQEEIIANEIMESNVAEVKIETDVEVSEEEYAKLTTKIEDFFFWGEVAFLLTTIITAMYAIYADKDVYIWVMLLGMYVFTIKGFRRLFINTEELQKTKTKVIIGTYLTVSTIGCGYMVYAVIKAMA